MNNLLKQLKEFKPDFFESSLDMDLADCNRAILVLEEALWVIKRITDEDFKRLSRDEQETEKAQQRLNFKITDSDGKILRVSKDEAVNSIINAVEAKKETWEKGRKSVLERFETIKEIQKKAKEFSRIFGDLNNGNEKAATKSAKSN